MAGEIAVRQLTTVAAELENEGASLEHLLQKTGIAPVEIADPFARIDWADYAAIFELLAQRWGFEKLTALGAKSVYSEDALAFREGMFLQHDSMVNLLQSVCGPNGAYSIVLPCMQFAIENAGSRTWQMTTTMLPGYDLSKPQHHYGAGTVIELPRILFEKRAKVSLEFSPNSATYLIELPQANPLALVRRRLHRAKPNPNFMRLLQENFTQLAVRQNRLQVESAKRLAAETKLAHTEKMEALGNLTGGIAHDFNNLLSVMVGQLDMLQADLSDPALLHRANEALAAAQRGAALTQKLLAFGRQAQLHPVAMDANATIKDMRDLLAVTLDETIEIKFSFSQEPCGILVDRNQFENALINMAINARDAMPKGGLLEIDTSCASLNPNDTDELALDIAPGDYVVITVADHGMGIEKEALGHVFEPFFTTKDTGQGTGLGLSMVWGFLQQSGGTAAIQSESDVGTVVTMYLPRQTLPTTTEEAPKTSTQSQPLRENLKILVVEDQGSVRDVVEEMLRSLGAQVSTAEDGQAAKQALDADSYDLLLTDIMLPGGLLGPDIAKHARAQQTDIRVAFMSGNTQDAIAGESQSLAGEKLLYKPFTVDALSEFIDQVLKDYKK